MFAIIQSGGRQIKVEPGAVITVDLVNAEPGTEIISDQVLLVGGNGRPVSAGTPHVSGARVVATVLGKVAGPKIRVFKKKRRKGYRRTNGHRSTYTRVQVKDIIV